MTSTTSMPAARPLEAGDEDRLAAAMANALLDEPFLAWLAQGDQARVAEFLRLGMTHIGMPRGMVLVTRHVLTGHINGGLVMARPGAVPGPPADALRMLPGLVRSAGLRRVPRIIRALARLETAHPDEPHWSGLAFGVVPADRGHGYGRALIEAATALVDAEGLPAYLETSDEDNAVRYRRHGFEVRERIQLPRGGPVVTTMWRPNAAMLPRG